MRRIGVRRYIDVLATTINSLEWNPKLRALFFSRQQERLEPSMDRAHFIQQPIFIYSRQAARSP